MSQMPTLLDAMAPDVWKPILETQFMIACFLFLLLLIGMLAYSIIVGARDLYGELFIKPKREFPKKNPKYE